MLRKTFTYLKGPARYLEADEELQLKISERELIEEEILAAQAKSGLEQQNAGMPHAGTVITWRGKQAVVQQTERPGGLRLVDRKTNATVWDSGVEFLGSIIDAGPAAKSGADRLSRDRAKLKGIHDRASASQQLGLRVAYVKATSAYHARSDEELTLSRGDTVGICANTRAGWSALGFEYDDRFLLGTISSLEVVATETRDMIEHKVFQVRGLIGKVPKSVVEAMNVAKLPGTVPRLS
jgi:hypothetical protein